MADYTDGYPLTIEILKDNPCGAGLKKDQICRAKYYSDTNKDFKVCDEDAPKEFWSVPAEYAKIISEA